MPFIYRDFLGKVEHITHQHRTLCVLALGVAIVAYPLRHLFGRAVSWIIESMGTTQKTEQTSGKAFTVLSKEVVSAPIDEIQSSFKAFTQELEEEIFPFYEAHEKGFDQDRIHGRLHVARAVLFCEVMARYYHKKGEQVDFNDVRRITGMHDAGRKGNGVDRWEKESADLLRDYFQSKGVPEQQAEKKAAIIIKDSKNENLLSYTIFQSADCLDIMRPCTRNGGRKGFKPEYLTFLKDAQGEELKFRNAFIEEAWAFIQITEKEKMTTFEKSKGFTEKLLHIIENRRSELPILASLLITKPVSAP